MTDSTSVPLPRPMALLVDVDADEQENLEQNFPTISFTAAHGVARA